MRIIVLGAAGRTGRRVVEEAGRAGHQVTAIVRDPGRMTPSPFVQVRRGDVLEPGSLQGGFVDADAVVFAVGPANGKLPTTVYSRGMANVVAEMRQAARRRLVAISAVPVSAPSEKTVIERSLVHPLLWRFFGPSYADLRVMENDLRGDADIDWTIVRPPRLTDDPATGSYRQAVDTRLKKAGRISRSDLAAALVAAAGNDTLIGHVITVAH